MTPVPPNDDERIATLRSYAVLDTPKEESFDALTRLAARLFGVAIALVSLVDKDHQWFKSPHGLDAEQTPRDQAFCTHAIMENEPLVVLDATLDERFSDNPLVTGAPVVITSSIRTIRAFFTGGWRLSRTANAPATLRSRWVRLIFPWLGVDRVRISASTRTGNPDLRPSACAISAAWL